MAFGAVDEDRNGEKIIAHRELAAGEDDRRGLQNLLLLFIRKGISRSGWEALNFGLGELAT